MNNRVLFRKFVVYMAKPIPGKKPFWPFVLGTIGIGVSWTFTPYVFLEPFTTVPILSNILSQLPLSKYLPYILAYTFPTFLTFICLMPICRGIQLLDPEEFNQYNDD